MLLLRVSEHAYCGHCNKLKPAFCFTGKILPNIEKLKMKLFWMLLSPEVRKMIVKIARLLYLAFSFSKKFRRMTKDLYFISGLSLDQAKSS
jgi:hypothetical protein